MVRLSVWDNSGSLMMPKIHSIWHVKVTWPLHSWSKFHWCAHRRCFNHEVTSYSSVYVRQWMIRGNVRFTYIYIVYNHIHISHNYIVMILYSTYVHYIIYSLHLFSRYLAGASTTDPPVSTVWISWWSRSSIPSDGCLNCLPVKHIHLSWCSEAPTSHCFTM